MERFRTQTAEIEQKNQWAEQLNAQLKERGARIEELQNELVTQTAEAELVVANYEAEIARLDEESRKTVAWAQETERALNAQLATTVRDLEAKCNELARCVDLLHESEKLSEERTVWAQSLQTELDALKAKLENYQAQVNYARSSRWLKLGRALHVGPDIQEQ